MKNFFWDNIFKSSNNNADEITHCWQNTPLFKNIPARHISALATNMHVRNFEADEVIFREGDQGAGAILVLEGKVKIMANNTILAELEKGDFFGEIALAETDKRTADAYCIDPACLIYFLKQDLEEWIEVEPRLGTVFLMNLASTLAQRLHQANLLLADKA
jgi:CRP-like cAMP-binding protein